MGSSGAYDLEVVFPNERIKDALSFISTYVRDFVSINKGTEGKEYISFNVESLLSKLTTIKSDKLRRTSIIFNVGINTIYFDKPLPVEVGEYLNNFSFVGEKIGVKYRLRDKHFWQTRNPGETYTISGKLYKKLDPPREPVISNIHFLLYGSGLIYNLVNTGTTRSFNSPVFGGGVGVSFFNSLDLSLTSGIPILKSGTLRDSFRHRYIGIGLDFPFDEYIKRLSERNRDYKNKKLLAETSHAR